MQFPYLKILFCIAILIGSFFNYNMPPLNLRGAMIEVRSNNEALHDYVDFSNINRWNVNVWNVRDKILQCKQFKSVDVKFVFPNTLHVAVDVHKPYAIWWNYKNFFLINKQGKIINDTVSEQDKNKYILIIGNNANEHLNALVNILSSSKYNGKVVSMKYIGERRWDIEFYNGITVKLPEKNIKDTITLLDILFDSHSQLLVNSYVIDMRLSPERIFIKKR